MSTGKNLRKKAKRKVKKVQAALDEKLRKREIVTSRDQANTVSAETRGIAAPVRPKILSGGLPGQGRGD